MRTKLLVILALVGFLHAPARAAKMVDSVLDQAQTTATFTAFRNANFALHIGVADGLNSPRYDYWKPTDATKTRWMLDLENEHVTTVPSTGYADLSVVANQLALIRAAKKWQQTTKADGYMVDCIMETAPGQGQYAADFIRRVRDSGVDFIVNTGDPYTASDADTTTPWGRINQYAPKEWIQAGVNLGEGGITLSQQYAFSRAVAHARIAAGKMIIIGVFDPGGAHASTADAFFKTSIFSNPLVYGHYNTSLDSKVNVGLQLPGGKPVTGPSPSH